jgi:FxsC-like protein
MDRAVGKGDLYFFLSYARSDDDAHVHQLYQDLSAEVRAHAGLRAGENVGFFDVHSLEMGSVWPRRLVAALSRCRTFIALVSPRYLLSDPCGREWSVFADRLRRYEAEVGVGPAALLPLQWLPPRNVPEVVAALTYDHHGLPSAYRRAGLRQLMRLQRHRDHYLEFVSELARQIVEIAELHRLPPAPAGMTFDQVTSVFAHPLPAPAAADRRRAQRVRFIVAAPSRRDLASTGMKPARNRAYYGNRPEHWAPYQPAMPRSVADLASEVAIRRSFEPEVTDTSRLAEDVAEARAKGQILVLLVDPWATRLTNHRRALTKFNEMDTQAEDLPKAVLVPASRDDAQTQEQWLPLSDSVRALLSHRAAFADEVMFRTGVPTHDAFDVDLQVALEVAQNRIFGIRERPPVLGESAPFLRLHGHMSEDENPGAIDDE